MRNALSERDLRRLAADAATLRERLDGHVVPAGGDPAIAERRLAEWRRVVARGDAAAFRRRLALAGLDEDVARASLGEVAWPDRPLPEWCAVVAEAVDRAGVASDDCGFALPVAAEEGGVVAVPFIRAGRERLRARLGPRWRALPEAVRSADEVLLAEAVAWRLRVPIDDALARERRRRYDRLGEALLLAAPDPPCAFHDDVLAHCAGDGLAGLLRAFPVAARSAAQAVLDWVEATAELHERVILDAEGLAAAFNDGAPVGDLVQYGTATSDAHHGGRRVRECVFASGLRLMYKPASLRSEVAFSAILAEVASDDPILQLRAPRALDRATHGWSEFVEHRPAEDGGAAQAYYARAGVLLAILHGLGGGDVHLENLVAAGDQPVMVDAETLLTAVPALGPVPADQSEHAQLGAVISVGLLPWWVEGDDGRAVDISALGAREPQESTHVSPRWAGSGTDAARIVVERGTVRPAANVLMRDGDPVHCEEYREEVEKGFAIGYRRLLSVREQVIAGPLALMEHARVRTVLRPTHVYARTLLTADRAATLRHGVDRSLQLEILYRPVVDHADPTAWSRITEQEIEALERGDIPAFAAPGGAAELPVGASAVPLQASAVERAAARLRLLGARDLELQSRYVRLALDLRGATTSAPVRSRSAVDAAPLDGARALAVGIADDAQRVAGSVVWIAPQLADDGGRWRLAVAGADTYTGLPGIVLALAAYARVADDQRIRALVREAMEPQIDELDRNPLRFPARYGISLARGCAGMAVALDQLGSLLDDARYRDAARRLLGSVDEEHVRADRRLDLIGGAAGLLHAATRLDLRPQAVLAAGHLEARAEPMGNACGWRTIAQQALTGASHGTTGIGAALVLAGERFLQADWIDLGARALLLDDQRFDAAAGGWPDLRDHRTGADGPAAVGDAGWCHGVSGYAVSYGAIAATSIGASMVARMSRAVDLLAASSAPEFDHLCCGGAGWAEVSRVVGGSAGAGDRRDRIAGAANAWCRRAAGHALAHRLLLQGGRSDVAARAVSLMAGRGGVLWALTASEDPSLPAFAGLIPSPLNTLQR